MPEDFRPEAAVPSVEEKKAADQLSILELLRTLARRRATILAFLVLGLLVGLLFGLRRPKYTSSGELRVEPGRSAAYESSPLASSGSGDEKITAEIAILQSRTVLTQVAQKLNLANNPDFIHRSGPAASQHYDLANGAVREEVIRQLRKDLSITRAPRDEVFSISCTTYSPTLSATIINTLTSLYIERVFQVRYGTSSRITNWLISQLDDLRDQVQHDQEELVTLQQKLGIIGFNPKDSTLLSTSTLEGLTKASTDATISRIISEARLRYLQEMNPGLIESETPLLPQTSASPGSLLQTLRASQATAEAKYASLSQKFDVNYPDVKQAKAELDALNAQIKKEQDRILGQASVAYQAADANEKMTKQVLDSQEKQSFNRREDMVRYIILEREYESHRDLYEGLMLHLRQAGIDAGMKSADVDILDVAEVPVQASGLGALACILLGLLGGAVLGIGVALVRDLVDTHLNDPDAASAYLGLANIGVLPLVKTKNGATEMTNTAYVEAMQLLRSGVLLSGVGHAPKVVVITSAIPGEGKSTTSRNLALTFASHSSRVLLVDADLRRPVQFRAFKVSNQIGLSSILSSSVEVDPCILSSFQSPNLFFLPAGPTVPNPAVLLGSERMRALTKELGDRFDLVIFDSAPITSTTDTLLFSRMADAVVLIVRQNLADRRWIEEAKTLLQRSGSNLVGFVMNAVDYSKSSYYSYHTYGSGYGSYESNEEKGPDA